MKRAQQPERFYYDITIEHDPAHTDERHYMKSKAEKTIYMESPLMEDPGDYNMSVCKFSINTEAIPVFIPELNNKQYSNELEQKILWSNHLIDFDLTCDFKLHAADTVANDNDNDNGNDDDDDDEGPYVITQNPDEEGYYLEGGYTSGIFLTFPINEHPNGLKKLSNWEDEGYIVNLDEQCYYYDYTTLVNVMNTAFKDLTNETQKLRVMIEDDIYEYYNLKHWCETGNNSSYFYFELKDSLLVLNVHKDVWKDNDYTRNVTLQVKFPMYLLRFIGNGFKTKINSDATWEYDYNWKELGAINENIAITQEYSTLVNWNPLKAIVIGSDTIPAVGEFLPIAHYDGWLNHEKSEEYDTFLKETGQTRQDKDRDIFKKNTTCILDIYYPALTNPGDIRSNCVFSRDDISNGQVIELRHASPLTRFNIWIKWLDIYGNLHDLYLLPGRSCDIRFCFIKKPVSRETMKTGVESVVKALAPPEEKKNKKERSNGKPNGIVLDGADNYGWVHL